MLLWASALRHLEIGILGNYQAVDTLRPDPARSPPDSGDTDGSQALAHSVAHTYILTGTYRTVTYRSDHHPKTGTCPFDREHRLDSNKAPGRFRYIHHTTLR